MFPGLEKCPRSLLVCEKSSFEHEKSGLNNHVSKHYFNHKVSLVIPECGSPPPQLASVIQTFSKYFLVKNLPVYEFLEEDFLENVVRHGGLYALSYKTLIDQDNTIALLPNSQLILSVDKDTYEQLGLEGKASQYSHKCPMRYVVTVDLTDKSMAPGGKRYQRVLSSLKDRLPLKSDFLLARHRSDGDRVLQSLLSRYHWKDYSPVVSTHTLRDLSCPSLQSKDLHGDQCSCDPHSFLEWLGAVSNGVSCDNAATDFLSTYVCPEPKTAISQVLHCAVSGFLLPEDIYSLLQELRRYFDEPKFTSWLSLTVHGFMDSPVSWGDREHGFHKGGENFYNVVLFKNQDYWLQMGTGSNDKCPP
ncbi:ribonuclease P protein subunit p40 isoform X2 [Esox lucius]|uniref:ribonuclease P protein subunit p40 isoform X2 n=1 Tax=Esox lucius TaxID=8010 RepID=UPI0005764B70|nr:ribonuclease P protein subunit p40 isoform X2 [Esox lucius]